MLSTRWPAKWKNLNESIRLGNLSLSYGAVIENLTSRFARGAKAVELRRLVTQLKLYQAEIEDFKAAFDKAHEDIYDKPYDFNSAWVRTHRVLDGNFSIVDPTWLAEKRKSTKLKNLTALRAKSKR